MAVRMKNVRLEQDNRKLKAENERLRAKCGEAAVAEVQAELAAARLAAPPETTTGAEGQQVKIGRLAAPVQMHPLFAKRARADAPPGVPLSQVVVPSAPAQPIYPSGVGQPDDLPVSTQPQDLGDEELPSKRFALLEPRSDI